MHTFKKTAPRSQILKPFDTLIDALDERQSQSTTFSLTFLFLIFLIFPLYWLDNEVNYFDLGRRLVSPDAFPLHSAVFDDSLGRIVGLGLIGGLAELLGSDVALIVTRIAVAIGFAAAFSALAAAWSLSASQLLLALAAFMLLEQSYFAGEWLFKGVEAKVLAYIAVVYAIAFASRRKLHLTLLCIVLATYFHFLVGGFWALATLLLIALMGGALRDVVRLALVYLGVILPLLIILLYERVAVATPDLSGYQLTLNEIYGVFRSPHHLAPFASLSDFADWIPGIFGVLAMLLALTSLPEEKDSKSRTYLLWLILLNAYLLLALALAFIDRNTHFLAPFYVFRPNSLILLLSLLILVQWLSMSLGHRAKRGIAVLALALLVAFAGPYSARSFYYVMKNPSIPSQAIFEDDHAPALLEWIRKNTPQDAVVVIQHVKTDTMFDFWLMNFERLVGRPTLVNWKFVPTAKTDLARWYRLIDWRDAVFKGDCSRVSEQPVDFLVAVDPETRRLVENCGTLLWAEGDYGVVGNLR